MCPSHYKINVSQAGKGHIFATSEHSGANLTLEAALELHALFCRKFPIGEGYEVRLSRVECYGQDIRTERQYLNEVYSREHHGLGGV